MDFDLTERQAFFRDRVRDFIDAHVRPRRCRLLPARSPAATAGSRCRLIEELKPNARKAGPVEPVHAARRRAPACRRELRLRRRAAHQPRICALRRGDGADPLVGGGVQLLGARHRQHGGAPPLRHARAEGAMAAPADARRDPLGLPDDRARRSPRPTRPTSNATSPATATTMSSTAANGGRRAPAIRAARSRS